jgi:hypothetical protein
LVPCQTGIQGCWPSFTNRVMLCCHVMCKADVVPSLVCSLIFGENCATEVIKAYRAL